jgi:hypothetical protein
MDQLDLSAAIAGASGVGLAILLLTRAEGVTWRKAWFAAIAYGAFVALILLIQPLVPDIGPISGRSLILVVALTALVCGFLVSMKRRRDRGSGSASDASSGRP